MEHFYHDNDIDIYQHWLTSYGHVISKTTVASYSQVIYKTTVASYGHVISKTAKRNWCVECATKYFQPYLYWSITINDLLHKVYMHH